ncbi:MAG TPA: hypothetical protein VK463_01280 [Desulfomonilaceae bacterium]|nr:hypothetical protein [Desulfomonilaceae bacterium]
MNSSVEEILAFKTCCGLRMFDQNLEIHILNQGDVPVVVPSSFALEGHFGVRHIDTLVPSGKVEIPPGTITAFYCSMDEALWNEATRMVFRDEKGNAYPVLLDRSCERGIPWTS